MQRSTSIKKKIQNKRRQHRLREINGIKRGWGKEMREEVEAEAEERSGDRRRKRRAK